MTLIAHEVPAPTAAPGSDSLLEQILGRVRWTLTDAAHLELAAGDRVDARGAGGPFLVVLRGELQAALDGTTRRLRAGDVLLRTRAAPIRLRATADVAVVIGSLQLGDDLTRPLRELLPDLLIAHGLLAGDAQVRSLADLLVAELAATRPGAALLASGIAGLLAAAALRAWVECGCAPEGWLSSRVDPDVARVVDAIRADPGGAWSLERLASLAHTSRSVFVERFRAAMGDSPTRYLTGVRMEHAKSLLAGDRVSVAQAAARSGYGSDAAFSRAFSRHTGMAPSAWRRGRSGDPAALSAAPARASTVASR